MTTVLEAKNVFSGYGGAPVLRDLTLSVGAGEVVALFGPNGAGKTTTILTLAGELQPSQGEVFLLGSKTTAPLHRRARAGLALVPEERGIVRELSVRDNLRLGRATIDSAIAIFPELEPLQRRTAGLLSGGEQQMLSLARALAAEPSVMLVDELSLGLAPIVVKRLLRAVKETAATGVGVLLVEQYAHRAIEIADRAYVLNRGQIVYEAGAAELPRLPDELESIYMRGASTTATDKHGEGTEGLGTPTNQ